MNTSHQELKLFFLGSGFTLAVLVIFTFILQFFILRSNAQSMMMNMMGMSPECMALFRELATGQPLAQADFFSIVQEKGCMSGFSTESVPSIPAPTPSSIPSIPDPIPSSVPSFSPPLPSSSSSDAPTFSRPSFRFKMPTSTFPSVPSVPFSGVAEKTEEQRPSASDAQAGKIAVTKKAFLKLIAKYEQQTNDLSKLQKNKKKFNLDAGKIFSALSAVCQHKEFISVGGTCIDKNEFKSTYNAFLKKDKPERIIDLFGLVIEEIKGSLE